MAYKVFSDLHR